MKIRIAWMHRGVRTVVLGVMLALVALGAGETIHFVYQAY